MKPNRSRSAAILWGAAAVVMVALAVGIAPRVLAQRALTRQTAALSEAAVAVMHPQPAPQQQEIVLPGDVEAFRQTPIYARASGYLAKWTVDIGSRVTAGQLLAEIDAPELDDQLRQARADRKQALANQQLAQVTAGRYQDLLKTNSVSRQEADAMAADAEAKQALLEAANSNVARLEKLQSYEKVYAPFGGTITARNVDVGALIEAGSAGGPARELFDLAQTGTLRVYVDVPQGTSRQASAPGAKAYLTLPEFPGRRFAGAVARSAGAINPVTRTLRVEVDVPNADGAVLPGAFAQVHLQVDAGRAAWTLPVNMLLFRPQGVQVATVNSQGQVLLKTIAIGRDFGSRVEVASGLSGDEDIILNPSDAIFDGMKVRVAKDPAKS
ncbi:MAG: efflux RND transporter periplasmic adaptor subunit [Hyphomicrobiales bacterium]|nr:efflux RND transporter periplasmic adaptor subunit [Hyphomicrobiales bacterium]